MRAGFWAGLDSEETKQANQLFHNLGGRFEETSANGGEAFAVLEVSRGAAFGDVDNDGDEDVLLINNNGPVRLLLNRVGSDTAWLGLAPVRASAGEPDPGGRVGLQRSDAVRMARRAGTDGSYCSARDPRRRLGLGGAAIEAAEVRWLNGHRRRWLQPPERRYLIAFAPSGAGAKRP